MPQLPDLYREAQEQADRLTRLEMWQQEAKREFGHIHACMHDVKEAVNRWDKRWWIGVGILAGLAFASGGGIISLQSVIKLLSSH